MATLLDRTASSALTDLNQFLVNQDGIDYRTNGADFKTFLVNNLNIPALTASAGIDGTEVVPVDDAGLKKATIAQLLAYINQAFDITALTAGSALTNTDVFMVDQGLGARKVTGTELKTFIGADVPADVRIAEVNISAGNKIIDLTSYEAFADGSIIRTLWTGGTAAFTATYNTTFTIGGILASAWVGHGKGGLVLRKNGTDWEVERGMYGDVWDKLTDMDKYTNGKQKNKFQFNTVFVGAVTVNTNLTIIPAFLGLADDFAAINYDEADFGTGYSIQTNTLSTITVKTFVAAGSAFSGTVTNKLTAIGYWTTLL